MKNVQISMDEELLAALDKEAKPLKKKRSAIIREAVREWLRQRKVARFENEWIDALRQTPDDDSRAEDWRDVQTWDET